METDPINKFTDDFLSNRSLASLGRDAERDLIARNEPPADLRGFAPAALDQLIGVQVILPPEVEHYIDGHSGRFTTEQIHNLEIAVERFHGISVPYYIQIGQEVPIVTESQSKLTGAALGGQNVFQTIQQRDIGRILNVTPHVTEKRQVTLDINLEISDTLPSSTVRGTPSFSKRSINSSVVVEDRQTLMIGGIIDKSSNNTRSGFPWLKDIPYIGFLFSNIADTNSRSELLILLTPHVVGSPEDGIVETRRFKERLEMLQKEMGAAKK